MSNWRGFTPVHPLADSFPKMSDGELRELAEDIKKNSQREPVIFAEIDGVRTLIDGRHRLEACTMIGREAWTTTVELKDDAAVRAFIISQNVYRRHLTPEGRQKRLEAAIIANPTASARAIAEKAGVDKNKLVKARKNRQLCRNAILEHIPADAVERYQRNLDRARKQLRRALRVRVS